MRPYAITLHLSNVYCNVTQIHWLLQKYMYNKLLLYANKSAGQTNSIFKIWVHRKGYRILQNYYQK